MKGQCMPSEADFNTASRRLDRLEAAGAPPADIAAARAEYDRIDEQLTIQQLNAPRTRAGQS
jgi:hypothetical protein